MNSEVMWWDSVENPIHLKNLYDECPSLEHVEILEMELQRNGPSVLFAFSTDVLPGRPPVKWGAFNRVTFQFRLFDVEALSISKFGRKGFSQIQITKINNIINAEIMGTVSMTCSANYLDVTRIVGYQWVEFS